MPTDDQAEIHCPKCQWRPGPSDRWSCDACFTAWNTFWTRGVCPGCAVAHAQTQCLECGAFSPHEAWYHPKRRTDRTDTQVKQAPTEA